MSKQIPFMCRPAFCVLLSLSAVLLLSNVFFAAEVAILEVKYRSASELLPIVESMLSVQGTVTVSARVNSLVIVDEPEAIQRVRAYLDRFDRPVQRVRISVRLHGHRSDRGRDVSTRARASGNDWSVSTGGKKKDGVEIQAQDAHRRQRIYSEYFVVTTSGSPAYIRTGKEIPFPESWPGHPRKDRAAGDTVVFKTVDAGFEVTPTIVGDHANLKILPRIAYDDTEAGVIRFFGAQTELTAPLGQWVEIGGVSGRNNEVINEILSQGRSDGRTSMFMSLMVEKY